ncbi:F-box associated domain type 1 [Arabidopsis thaliana x Arabidopsis arenosa]|uniref:F-box associated domain type 1 n=1 Tax=Arabidopsis thaliana x Arabidopsis arenosa TaxID=1240361 RepID=A0A8T2C716_9BRAS|nr:F-box associated domain type 1 [Arabidopsis thaliana x Arabidopsis arenosa]
MLVRVPPRSLVGFRSVCKQWKTLFNTKRFVNRNFACGRSEFMLKTHSHIYAISVNLNDDPSIKVSDLCFDLRRRSYHLYGTCDGYFFIYDFLSGGGGVISNPLLRHTKWIAEDGVAWDDRSMGYDGSRTEKIYKIIGILTTYSLNKVVRRFSVFDFATNAWKVTDHTSFHERLIMDESSGNSRVSLNGNLYWTAYKYCETGQYFIRMLDFSKEKLKMFCILPCKAKKSTTHTRILSIYKGDRFSVMEQCKRTREIEIWVTKNKIGNGDDGDDVVWIKFMTVSIPNFPLVLNHYSTSYFVDDNIYGKSFVLCCPTKKPKQAWVHIVRGDLYKKIKIDEVVCRFESSVFVPSLITIP